jgi:HEAT repeat protein
MMTEAVGFQPRTNDRRVIVERRSGWDRRSGQDRCHNERRIARLPIARERRRGADRRSRLRRTGRDRRRRAERRTVDRRRGGTDVTIQRVECAFSAVAKVFHLSRLYPPTHPALAEATQVVSATLPNMVAGGAVECKVGLKGLTWNAAPVLPRNPALVELSRRLHTRGVRTLVVQPGATAAHLSVMLRVARGELPLGDQGLGDVVVLSTKRSAAPRQSTAVPEAGDTPFSWRSTGVFRPEALPPDIEARRLLSNFMPGADPAPRLGNLRRLAELAPELASLRQPHFLAEVVAVLERVASERVEPELSMQATDVISRLVDDTLLVWMVQRIGDPEISRDERQALIRAVSAVGERAGPFVVDAYLGAAPQTRAAYREALRGAGERVAHALRRRLSGEGPDVIVAAVDLLGAVGGMAARFSLMECARHPSAVVREHAAAAMAEIGGRKIVQMALLLLKDAEPEVRASAARALVAGNDPAVSPLIVARLGVERDEDVRLKLLWALGRLGDDTTVRCLTTYGEPGVPEPRHNPRVRAAATEALGALGTPEAQRALMALAQDGDAVVRNAATRALG